METSQQGEMKEVAGYSGAAHENPAQGDEENFKQQNEQLKPEQRLQHGEQWTAARNELPLRRTKTCPASEHTTFVDCSYADRMRVEDLVKFLHVMLIWKLVGNDLA
ncbi:hypothetical protein EC968_001508 [Mortierella alpina]|nr:hypothetical protein EC968_001508 [Mortierella alpina]